MESVDNSPVLPLHRQSQYLSLSRASVHRKLRHDLQHKPYLVQVKLALLEEDITSWKTILTDSVTRLLMILQGG